MDWITARLQCSIEHAWNVLCEGVRSDLDIWKAAQTHSDPKIEFSIDANIAVITKNSPDASTSKITLRRNSNRITAELPGRTMTLTPLVNEAGECRMKVGNDELEFWQASRKILEAFLFADEA
jgi:hypothetical protein